MSTQHCWDLPVWSTLKEAAAKAKTVHLRDSLKDAARNDAMTKEHTGILLDFSRQKMDVPTYNLLVKLAEDTHVHEKLLSMMKGDKLNTTEGRSVLHTALRAPKSSSLVVDGVDVVKDVHAVLDNIEDFSNQVREGKRRGVTGKVLKNIISIGIGGSYLGPEFVYEALRCDATASAAAAGRSLKFLANVDPVDVARATEGFDPEETLVIVVSKTFTTAETMLNARSLREWLLAHLSKAADRADAADIISKHIIAVSSNIPATSEFGIDPKNVFGFWDWVGGRYSVTSAVGVVPLALHYGMPVVKSFLSGAHDIDQHVANDKLSLPVIMGLLGVWNSTFLGLESRALLPYSQALLRFAAHIQQVDMESNGKRVHLDGTPLPFNAGEVNFGEPGTNGQHSFYQLIHQGRIMACDFVGFSKSQKPLSLKGEPVSNHDELMSNFFAQPDALAVGKRTEELVKEGVPEALRSHKEFPGDRPSLSLLLDQLDAFSCGQLLAIYEHRTAVQGFVWGNNSFDQWGVELGKVLAKQVRTQLTASREKGAEVKGFNSSTTKMLQRYLK